MKKEKCDILLYNTLTFLKEEKVTFAVKSVEVKGGLAIKINIS